MSERKPRCIRCNRRQSKDPRSVQKLWFWTMKDTPVCPDCQSSEEATESMIVNTIIDWPKVNAAIANGLTREELDHRDYLRADLDPKAYDTAMAILTDVIVSRRTCDRCNTAKATRRSEELDMSLCDHCADVMICDVLLDMDDAGQIEILGSGEIRLLKDEKS